MDLPRGRIWLKAFWGFNPEEAGYLGFTHAGVRDKLIENYASGDLILIYGADSPETETRLRGQALGFLEIVPEKASDQELMSPHAIAEKNARGWGERWRHAVPVSRAWRVGRKIAIHHVAPNTDWRRRGRVIASQAELMVPEDAAGVWSWPVTQVPVWGRDEQPPDSWEQTLEQSWAPSIGPKPVFGSRTSEMEDGDTVVYILQLEGDVCAFLGLQPYELKDQKLIKVGRSNKLDRRASELNAGFPPSAKMKWVERLRSRPFPSALLADEAEKGLHQAFAEAGRSQGGEFFLCSERKVESIFSVQVEAAAFSIKAPPKN